MHPPACGSARVGYCLIYNPALPFPPLRFFYILAGGMSVRWTGGFAYDGSFPVEKPFLRR
jgi:prolipoprotein diacylglyceryltransferase